MTDNVARRTVLRAGAALAVAAAIPAVLPGSALAAPPDLDQLQADVLARVRTGELSANGWDVEKGADIGGAIWTRAVEGTGLRVALAIGAAQTVLCHVIRRYHYTIDELRPGDVVGYHPIGRRSPAYTGNHASGTAIDICQGKHPAGARDTLFAAQRNEIRVILAECRDLVTWGGDFKVPDEAHFEIAVGPADTRLAELAEVLATWKY